MSWEIKKLEDITTKIGDGLHGTPKYNENGDYFFINGNNFIQGKVQIKQDTKRIDYDEYLKIKKQLNQQTLFVAINGTLGNVALYNDENVALGKSACYLNVREDISRDFVRYVLEDENFQRYAQLFATGATIKNLGLKAVREFTFELPPLQTQKRIASILSAYDNLIENNLKRIKLLEETAQNIYKEWFVNFRFPNYENTPFNEETGLPEGWEKGSFYEYVDIMSGGTPKTNTPEYYDGQIPFYTPKDASSNPYIYIKNTEKKITEVGLQKCNSKLYPQNTVFITARGTVGKVNLAMRPMAMNQSCYALKFKQNHSQFFLLATTFEAVEIIKKTATGGVFDTIVVDTFKRIPIVYPNNEVIVDYHNFVEPIFQQTIKIQEQINLLKEARDVLLPRLMNRTIEV